MSWSEVRSRMEQDYTKHPRSVLGKLVFAFTKQGNSKYISKLYTSLKCIYGHNVKLYIVAEHGVLFKY